MVEAQLYEAKSANRFVVPLLVLTDPAVVDPSVETLKHWGLATNPIPAAGGRRGVHTPKARTLGGSSAINTMSYLRGTKSAFDKLLKYFKKSCQSTRPAVGEARVSPSAKGFSDNEFVEHGAWIPSTINPENAHCSSVESSFLRDGIHRSAKRILFDQSNVPKTVGVEVEIHAVQYTINAAKEAIVSSGDIPLTTASHGLRTLPTVCKSACDTHLIRPAVHPQISDPARWRPITAADYLAIEPVPRCLRSALSANAQEEIADDPAD
ncbi:choline dehydrogenase [Apiospora rasikravindrae]|uniref:Choline dehydrogenase n=1 Tax=Apiospora rasikravindrae TaxID=990691 RepID=A0ABR1RYT0_9PEZI